MPSPRLLRLPPLCAVPAKAPAKPPPATQPPPTVADMLQLQHDLEVHQIELELQNEELRASQAELQTALARYTDLYDFAPVGYLTLKPDGEIRQLNFTATTLLGAKRSDLVNKRLGLFVGLADRAAFAGFLKRVFAGQSQACEVTLESPAAAPPLIVRCEVSPTPSGLECRVIMTNITERWRADEALRVESERRRILFEQLPDGIVTVDPQTARFVEFNRVAHEQLGYSREEFSRLTLHDLEAPETAAETKARMAEANQTGSLDFETRHRTRPGEIRHVHVTSKRVNVQGQVVHQCVFRDITERKRIEEQLRQLSRAVEQSPASIVLTDLQGQIEYVNPKFTQVSGYRLDEVRGQNPRVLKSGEMPPAQYARLWQVITSGGEWHGEFHNKRKNGELYWESASISPLMDAHGRITGFLGVKEDITERKQLEAKLRDSEHRLKSLIASMHDLVFVLDQDLRFEQFHQPAHQMLFVQPEQFEGKRLDEIGLPEPAFGCIHQAVGETLQTGNSAVATYRLDLPAGPAWFEMHVTTLPTSGGTRPGVTCVVRDITTRKQAEAALRENEARLRAITDSAQDAILMMNPEGAISYWNPAAERIFGYPSAEALGQNLHTFLVPPRYHAAHQAALPEFGQTGQGPAVGKMTDLAGRRKDGQEIAVQLSLSAVQIEGRWHAVGILRDITERKQMEVKLKEVAARFDELAEQSRTFAWEVDAAGLYTYVSPVAELVLGYRPEELVGRHFYDLHPETGREAFKQAAFAVFAQQERFVDLVNPVRTKAGGLRWVATNGIPLLNPDGTLRGYHGSDTDITERKRAEEEIRRQAALISSLLDSIPDMVFYKNTEGVYLGCNPIFVAFVGRPRNEIIGHTDYDLFDPEIADAFRDHDWQMMASREPRHNEEWITYPDGREALIDTLKSPYWGPDGALIGMLGISRDITARKQAEESLRQSESRFRTVIESSSLAIFVALDLKFSYLNPAALRLLGATTPAQLMGQPFLSRVHPSYHATIRERNAQVVGQQGLVPLLEEVYLRLDGTPVPVEVTASPIIYEGQPGAVVFVQDITERKRTHEALRAETERRHILFEQLPDGILVVDSQTARFVEFNTAAHQQLGYSRAEFARLTIHDVEAEETAAETKTHIAEVIQTGAVDFETRHRTRQGEIRDIHVTAQIVHVSGQAVHQCVWRDITERKRAEAELLHTLATERKLSALKTTFGTMVSHEFRTPLSTILGAAEMLEDFYASMPPEQQADYFGTIRREIQRLSGMLENVLLQGRLESGQVQFKPQATDVVAVCRDVLARVQLAFPKHPPVHFEADAPTHRTLADESLLECVLNNLLTNALKYSPALTPVRFSVRRVGEEWEIQVRDQGLGIGEEDQAFVFSAFRRGGNVGNIKGTGVGLYLVKKCSELQGGRVELRSQVGQGSTFVFAFPWRPAETAPAAAL